MGRYNALTDVDASAALPAIRLKKNITGYSLIAPYFVFLTVFSLIPIIRVLILSFQTEGILSPATWVGLDNYSRVFLTPEYLDSFKNNLVYLMLNVPLGNIMGLGLALIIRKKTRASAVFETIYFLPLLLSMVVAGVLMNYVFSLNGPLNYVLYSMGFPEINWFADPFLAKVFISFLEVWKGDTFFVFIYLAALRAIPDEYLEASRIDGGGYWKTLWHVILPLIRGTILFCVTMATIWNFQIFDSIVSTTYGGPLGGTTSMVFEIYKTTFKSNNVGVGAALSVLFLFVILAVSMAQMKTMDDEVEY